MALNILIVEDSASDVELLLAELRAAGFDPVWRRVETAEEFQAGLAERPEIILSDFTLPRFSVSRGLELLAGSGLDIPFVIVSGTIGEEYAVESVKAGATDYVLKDRLSRLGPVVRRALIESRERAGRQRAEQQLRIVGEKLRLFLEHSPAVFYLLAIKDRKITPLIISDNVQRLLGESVEEASRYDWWVGRLHPGDRDRVINSVAEGMAGGGYALEYRVRHNDGTYRWVEDNSRVVPGADGRADEVVGVWTDITPRKREEEDRTRMANEMRLLLESTSEGIYGVDREQRCTFVNRAASALLGYQPGELIGMTMHSLVHHHRKDGTSYPWEECPICRVLDTGAGIRVHDEVFWRRDGTSFPTEYAIAPILVEDAITGAVVTFTDCTEERKLEAQFLRNQRMESVGALAGGLAHDLNNVLAPIVMGLQLLREQFSDRESARLLDMISASADRGAGIVRQILAFARGTEGEWVPVQLRHLVAEQETICRDTFSPAIKIRKSFAPGLWNVMGDPTRLHQVLMNLCVNARDAMPDGGTLAIEAENIHLDGQPGHQHPEAKRGPHVVVTVSDTGCGIRPEIMDKIFDPFFTTKDLGKGTGLGLSSVLGIVKSHGGWVSVHTEIAKGTRFKIYLPAMVATQAPAEPPRPPAPRVARGETVLVVDDEKVIRDITREVLEANGYRVLTAADGIEAVAEFSRRGKEISLAITDLMMPLMDGRATIRTLRKMNPALKIIAMSGMSDEITTIEMDGEKDVAVLLKPFTGETLLIRMREVLAAT